MPALHPNPTALIAEDEPLLAQALAQALAQVWPELTVVATVGDGLSAVTQALALQPDLLLFDIRMPGQSGLDAAVELADAWPEHGAAPFPALVFVTAYDQYAVQAFETQAVDYVLKPVQLDRLKKTIQKVQLSHNWKERTAIPFESPIAQTSPDPLPPCAGAAPMGQGPTAVQLAQLAALLTQHPRAQTAQHPSPTAPPLRLIQASTGDGTALAMVAVSEVLVFEAADKYVRVLTAHQELLIRTPLKELLPQLDEHDFWQIHRGTVVRAEAIARATRDEAGRLWLHLRGRPERLAVSRLYAHRFRAM
jgi:DNA-binding LytR/AlgR family response regulator